MMSATVLRAGPVGITESRQQVTVDGEPLRLSPTEFRLPSALVEHPGSTQSCDQLLKRAWGVDGGGGQRVGTRTVDMHIRRLRTKLGEFGDWVETVRGFGYRFRVPGDTG